MKSWLKENAQRLAFLLALLGLWELTSRFGPWPHYLFPPPSKVGESLVRLATSGLLAQATGRSMIRLMQGYLLSAAIGVPLGILTARIKFFRVAVKPVIMGLQALPSICWLPATTKSVAPSSCATCCRASAPCLASSRPPPCAACRSR